MLVLITGATGHVGFRVLVSALNAGYRVRAAVRNQAKADAILAAPSIQAIAPGGGDRLTFVFVPDLLAPGAYDDAVRDVDYVIHVASPLARGIEPDRYEEDLILPAVQGTVGILSAAAGRNGNRVKRVVITSSIAALGLVADTSSSDRVFDETSRAGTDPVIGPHNTAMEAYAASKIRALAATEQFVQDHGPKLTFDVVNIHPSFVIGKNELVTDPKDILRGSNVWAFAQVLGQSLPAPVIGHTVHLDDVAEIHVRALMLDLQGKKVQSLVATSGGVDGTELSDAIAIVNRHFLEEVKSGVLPNNGTVQTLRRKIDASMTEKRLGMKFRSYEDQILSVTEHYLELVERST
ncbi:hypothetical protein VTN96DRAFT_5556 [Rasamsonia emersonii]|uniref:NAD-dependent epimerase/dehydratase domain-containing protein n=1 Tax=Rasamsonia emersonii (strain ATCC 16479 / CBS 393.64 / IMI 116815) TaxID=1408163 RepID=A0A0F4YYL3_RASE3|nr:hypothetical protein T310_3251 [Rasamsonia emersonii CBS 393.64]KKA22708.1 hypothetical protein T310_3251 [Rasamsonia emersonii CBS 393.64]